MPYEKLGDIVRANGEHAEVAMVRGPGPGVEGTPLRLPQQPSAARGTTPSFVLAFD